MITHTVMIDGQRPAEQTRTETIHQVTMPTEIITKTITIEGDGTPLTAQELRDIMAQQAGDSFSSEQVVTRVRIDFCLDTLSITFKTFEYIILDQSNIDGNVFIIFLTLIRGMCLQTLVAAINSFKFLEKSRFSTGLNPQILYQALNPLVVPSEHPLYTELQKLLGELG